MPEGFPRGRAWKQLADFLRLANNCAAGHGLKIVIEPLRREECNIINLISEAVELAALLDLPHVAVLGDTYHMWSGGESLSALAEAGELLCHMHIACPEGRAFPRENDPAHNRGEYKELFRVLGGMGYTDRISIEAGCTDLPRDAAAALSLLKAQMTL